MALTPESISKQCQDICDEIYIIIDELDLSLKKLCRFAAEEKYDYNDYLSEEDYEKDINKYYEKHKKILNRQNWKYGKANKETLNRLKELRSDIYRTDKYKEKQAGFLSPAVRQRMAKISEELENKIKHGAQHKKTLNN